MNPRASTPTTLSIVPRPNATTISSITVENDTSSPSSGVMSLKTIPGFGKSGTSRTFARRISSALLLIGEGLTAPALAAAALPPARRRAWAGADLGREGSASGVGGW